MKLVSVLVPAYNHEKYVGACLKSITNQTYQNLEIIIRDDCSTDQTTAEIKKNKDSRIKTIFSKKNLGVVDSLNIMLDMCHGDYIAVVGSDDIWYPTKIEKQVACLEKHQNIGGVFTLTDIIDEEGNVYESKNFPSDIFKSGNMSQGERARMFFKRGNHLCHSSSLLTKDAIKKVGKYNKTYRQMHDYDYWTRLINEYNIHVLDERLMGYRRTRKTKYSISSESLENSIRYHNEMFNINMNMIMNLKNDLFLELVGENNRPKTNTWITCKKILFLLKDEDPAYKMALFKYVFDRTDKKEIFECFEKNFNYTLNDFYDDTGRAIRVYPIAYFEEYRKQESEQNKLLQQNNELLANNHELLTENNKLVSKNNNLKEQLNFANREIQDIINSKSWQITTPLRKVSKIFKGKK